LPLFRHQFELVGIDRFQTQTQTDYGEVSGSNQYGSDTVLPVPGAD
jgi:hypothetical protein